MYESFLTDNIVHMIIPKIHKDLKVKQPDRKRKVKALRDIQGLEFDFDGMDAVEFQRSVRR